MQRCACQPRRRCRGGGGSGGSGSCARWAARRARGTRCAGWPASCHACRQKCTSRLGDDGQVQAGENALGLLRCETQDQLSNYLPHITTGAAMTSSRLQCQHAELLGHLNGCAGATHALELGAEPVHGPLGHVLRPSASPRGDRTMPHRRVVEDLDAERRGEQQSLRLPQLALADNQPLAQHRHERLVRELGILRPSRRGRAVHRHTLT